MAIVPSAGKVHKYLNHIMVRWVKFLNGDLMKNYGLGRRPVLKASGEI